MINKIAPEWFCEYANNRPESVLELLGSRHHLLSLVGGLEVWRICPAFVVLSGANHWPLGLEGLLSGGLKADNR